MRVAALYVVADGVYFGLPDVDPWDKSRDPRTYAGPCPVVAHPPCQRWGPFGGRGSRKHGADEGCFAAALAAVRRWGDVLDFSRARPLGPGPAINSSPLSRKQIKRLDELMVKLRAEYAAARAASAAHDDGPRDEAYVEGLPVDDDLP